MCRGGLVASMFALKFEDTKFNPGKSHIFKKKEVLIIILKSVFLKALKCAIMTLAVFLQFSEAGLNKIPH